MSNSDSVAFNIKIPSKAITTFFNGYANVVSSQHSVTKNTSISFPKIMEYISNFLLKLLNLYISNIKLQQNTRKIKTPKKQCHCEYICKCQCPCLKDCNCEYLFEYNKKTSVPLLRLKPRKTSLQTYDLNFLKDIFQHIYDLKSPNFQQTHNLNSPNLQQTYNPNSFKDNLQQTYDLKSFKDKPSLKDNLQQTYDLKSFKDKLYPKCDFKILENKNSETHDLNSLTNLKDKLLELQEFFTKIQDITSSKEITSNKIQDIFKNDTQILSEMQNTENNKICKEFIPENIKLYNNTKFIPENIKLYNDPKFIPENPETHKNNKSITEKDIKIIPENIKLHNDKKSIHETPKSTTENDKSQKNTEIKLEKECINKLNNLMEGLDSKGINDIFNSIGFNLKDCMETCNSTLTKCNNVISTCDTLLETLNTIK